MDEKTLQERLAKVELDIKDVAERTARQQEIVREMEDGERDASCAKHLLNNLIQMQIALKDQHDRILKQITRGCH